METPPLVHFNLVMKCCDLWLLFILSVACFSCRGACMAFSCEDATELLLSYPFGVRNSGRGDPLLQLQCDNNSRHMPLLDINGTQYYILNSSTYDYMGYYKSLFSVSSEGFAVKIIDKNLMVKECDLSSSISTMQFWSSDRLRIVDGYKNVTLWEGCPDAPPSALVSGCNGRLYYNTSSDMSWTGNCKSQVQLPVRQSVDPGPNLLLNIKEGFVIKWTPSNLCEDCMSENGTCAYRTNISSKPFFCDFSDRDRCQACVREDGACYSDYYLGGGVSCYCNDGTQSFRCSQEKRKVRAIGGLTAGIGIMLIVPALVLVGGVLYIRKFIPENASSSASQVEKFLQDFTHEMPTRYSYSQLQKITNNFADKLGEGGFGVVYKGKLSMGNLVAVKILDQSRQSESQFLNEVATIGRVRHVHLVRLMGYCFEGFRSALVYEFMTNGSLEKFVFVKKEKPQILGWEQLYSIALGAARGIAFLHEDCERRIIHFDIKPHNILLEADFTPKISDFGLAKLCGRLDDHISVTAARGTPGYVAPELWSRNLGPITEKADVYSFGMLLLEIVGGRKNIDVLVSRSSEVYFPNWAFKLLENGELEEKLRVRIPEENEGGRIGEEIEGENEMLGMKMCKVGLWCIQHNSMDRPTMRRVVEMLEGNGDDVSNPPCPFNSSASCQIPVISCSEESSSI